MVLAIAGELLPKRGREGDRERQRLMHDGLAILLTRCRLFLSNLCHWGLEIPNDVPKDVPNVPNKCFPTNVLSQH
eukprot:7069822-Heterocapsa_arctica.AAC.1